MRQQKVPVRSSYGLNHHGITTTKKVYWNLPLEAVFEETIARGEGQLGRFGPLVVNTGKYTGRSPNDKFIVREPSSEGKIWWGQVNRPFDQEDYIALRNRVVEYLRNRDLFVRDCLVGADPAYRIAIRTVTEVPWHSLFAANMFLEPTPEQMANHVPEWVVIDAPNFKADPEVDGTHSEAFILLDFSKKEVLIGGTSYAGETKKSIFTVMNYLLPLQGVLPMHSSANIGPDRDVAVFFGLSGTGKTTLSATSDRTLIGDDEHGWSDRGVFNFEGGCYAKLIRLSPQAEPEIYSTTQRFGSILENVVMDPATRELDLDSESLTENTRGSYPLSFIPNSSTTGLGGIPSNVFMLTADAFGIMPPIAKLTSAQAIYHFLSGYTARLAGTERGVLQPQATFSTCYGAPFMPLHPNVYAKMLGEKIDKHKVEAWMVNTGWTGGPYGVGHRMKIAYTRAMVRAALNGSLSRVPMVEDPFFGLKVPQACPDVPSEVLNPRNTWDNPEEYDAQAKKLARMFRENFKQFEDGVTNDILRAGPKAS